MRARGDRSWCGGASAHSFRHSVIRPSGTPCSGLPALRVPAFRHSRSRPSHCERGAKPPAPPCADLRQGEGAGDGAHQPVQAAAGTMSADCPAKPRGARGEGDARRAGVRDGGAVGGGCTRGLPQGLLAACCRGAAACFMGQHTNSGCDGQLLTMDPAPLRAGERIIYYIADSKR